jgi:hypothetical protein
MPTKTNKKAVAAPASRTPEGFYQAGFEKSMENTGVTRRIIIQIISIVFKNTVST